MKKITLLITLMISSLGFSQPTVSAPTPTRLAANVVSIFSDSFTDLSGTNFNPNWGQSGFNTANSTFDTGSGNFALYYPNFGYQGIQYTATDISKMEYVHLDIWTEGSVAPHFYVISAGKDTQSYAIPNVSGAWQSIDIPLSTFNLIDFTQAIQFKIDGGSSSDAIYIDNLYFYKVPVSSSSDATLSSLKVEGVTISGFTSSILSYTYSLPNGTTTVPTVTAIATQGTSSAVVTTASALPGDTKVLVTAQDNTTKTYTVTFELTGPSAPAPTPPNRNAADVFSLFSDKYTNIAIDTWSTSWDDSSITDITVSGDNVKKINFTNFLGVQLTNFENASAFTNFHMDYWIDTVGVGAVLNPKLSNHTGNGGETNALLYTNPVSTTGQWVSIDVPLTSFAGQPALDALNQFLISNGGPSAGPIVAYVDNIYLYKGTPLSTASFETSSIKIYPNPATTSLTIQANSTIDNVSVYTLLGQEVLNKNPKANDTTLDISNLQKGAYIVKTTSEGKTETTKVLKK